MIDICSALTPSSHNTVILCYELAPKSEHADSSWRGWRQTVRVPAVENDHGYHAIGDKCAVIWQHLKDCWAVGIVVLCRLLSPEWWLTLGED